MKTEFIIGLLAASAGFLLAAAAVFRLNPARAAAAEKFCRNPLLGAVLGAAAMALCVPQAAPIAWDWLADILWILVAVFTILAYLYLDYLPSRAIGGLLILGAYYFVNYAFALHTPGAAAAGVAAFALGVVGMFISAKPYLLRDWLRRCAANRKIRMAATVLLTIFAIYPAIAAILTAAGR